MSCFEGRFWSAYVVSADVILQAFNGQIKGKRKFVFDNFVQRLKVLHSSKLNGVFADYRKHTYSKILFSAALS